MKKLIKAMIAAGCIAGVSYLIYKMKNEDKDEDFDDFDYLSEEDEPEGKDDSADEKPEEEPEEKAEVEPEKKEVEITEGE